MMAGIIGCFQRGGCLNLLFFVFLSHRAIRLFFVLFWGKKYDCARNFGYSKYSYYYPSLPLTSTPT
jgi:hypothetical protein